MWIFLAFLSAIGIAVENVWQKKSTLHFNVILITWALLTVSSIFYLPLLIHSGIPSHLGSAFWPAVLVRVVIDSVALIIFIKALHLAHLSLALPMMSFLPVFVMIMSVFINHLFPTPLGVVGTLVIVAGVYFLNFDRDTKHLLSPFRNIAREKGVQLMLIACVLWSIIGPLERLAIDNSNVPFYTAFFQLFWAICFTPIAIIACRRDFKKLLSLQSITLLLPIGALDALQVLFQNIALIMTLPAYVSAVQSTNILFGALLGAYFFSEPIRHKIAPILVITSGILLITFSQAY